MNQFVEILSLFLSKFGQWINEGYLIEISKKNISRQGYLIDQSIIIEMWPTIYRWRQRACHFNLKRHVS